MIIQVLNEFLEWTKSDEFDLVVESLKANPVQYNNLLQLHKNSLPLEVTSLTEANYIIETIERLNVLPNFRVSLDKRIIELNEQKEQKEQKVMKLKKEDLKKMIRETIQEYEMSKGRDGKHYDDEGNVADEEEYNDWQSRAAKRKKRGTPDYEKKSQRRDESEDY